MSKEEIDETLHVAMTVGATRMQVMLQLQAESLVPSETGTEPEAGPEMGPETGPEMERGATPADSPTPDTPTVPLPTFKATEVVSQASGG